MLEQHTSRAQQALEWAKEEAYRAGLPFVQREQLFFGLLRDGSIHALLGSLGLDMDRARSEIEARVAPGFGAPDRPEDVGVLPTAQQVYVDRAKIAASQLGHTEILPEHILIGFLLERHGAVRDVLTAAGITKERVIDQVKVLLSKGG